MIIEGYDLHLYCDGPHEEWQMSVVLALPCTGEFGGRNRKEAWSEAARFGWTKRRGKVYCPNCSADRRRVSSECRIPEVKQ